MTMTDAELAEIRARAEAATPGEWWVMPDYEDPVLYVETTSHGGYFVCGLDDNRPDDAAFIAAARTDIPALCDEVEALRGELARARDCPHTRKSYEKLQVEHAALREYTTGLEAKLAVHLRDAGRGEPRP